MRFTVTTSNHMWTFALERDCLVEEMEPEQEILLESATELAEDVEDVPIGFARWSGPGLESSKAIQCQACHHLLDNPSHVLGCTK